MATQNSINNSCLSGITVSGGAVSINSGTSALQISTDASNTTVSLATGAAVKSVTLGSTNSTSATTVQSGSGALNVTSSNGSITITSGTGTIAIANDATNSTTTVATGSGVKLLTLGSTNSTSSSTLQSGSGGINITATNGTVTANSGTGTLSISSDSSATTVNIATGAAAKTVTIGSTNSSSSLALKTGTSDFSLASATGTIMSALDTGEITYPLQPCFLATINSNVLNVTGNGATFTLGTTTAFTEVFDRNSDFNTNGTFTAPVTGIYRFSGVVLVTGCTIATTLNLALVATGKTIGNQFARPAGADNLNALVSTLVSMTAGDTATLQVTCYGEAANTDDIYGDGVYTSFCGELIA